MKQMWIHWGKRNRQTEQNDLYDKYFVGKFLWNKYKIPTVFDEQMWFYRDNGKPINPEDYVTTDPRFLRTTYRSLTPDVWCRELKLAIEIDGGVHDSKKLQTEDRNKFYAITDMNLLIINKRQLFNKYQPFVEAPQYHYVGWENYLDSELKRLGILEKWTQLYQVS